MEENEIYESQLILYGITTTKLGTLYFDNLEEMNQYLKKNNISLGFKTKIEYMGNILNCIDVIRQTYGDGSYRYVSVVNEDGYMLYNFEQSKKEQQPIWEYLPGSLREMYDAFKKHGIKLEDDTYSKIDNIYHQKSKQHIKRQLA